MFVEKVCIKIAGFDGILELHKEEIQSKCFYFGHARFVGDFFEWFEINCVLEKNKNNFPVAFEDGRRGRATVCHILGTKNPGIDSYTAVWLTFTSEIAQTKKKASHFVTE